MRYVKIAANDNGAHNSGRGDILPEGWAMIPEDFTVPSSFPFVGIEAEEVTYTREVEVMKDVPKERDTGMVDEDGNPIMETYTVKEPVMEDRKYTMMTVISMTEGEVPPTPEPEPSADEKRDAQIFYTAMMTDTLLEEV